MVIIEKQILLDENEGKLHIAFCNYFHKIFILKALSHIFALSGISQKLHIFVLAIFQKHNFHTLFLAKFFLKKVSLTIKFFAPINEN